MLRRARTVAGFAIALALIGVCAAMFGISWRPSPEHFPIQGPDVSEATGPIDWFTLHGSGADFAYARATSGADHQDTRFAENWAGMYEAGVRRGALHVFSLCRLAADQAANFVRTVPRDSDQLPVAVFLDFEPGCVARPDRDVVIGEIRRLLIALETHSGKPTLLMVARPFEVQYRVAEGIPRNLWAVGAFFPPSYFPRPWRMWQANRFRRLAGAEQLLHWNVVAK